MRLDPGRLWREAEGQSDIEFVEGRHLPVKPGVCVGPEAVSPAQAGSQIPDPQTTKPADGVVQTVVLKVEPLTDAHVRRVLAELIGGGLRTAVLSQKS
jgi:hypothetical protein